MSDVSPLSGISGLSFDSTLLSPLLFFCLVLLPFLSYLFLPAGPFFQTFSRNSSVFFVKRQAFLYGSCLAVRRSKFVGGMCSMLPYDTGIFCYAFYITLIFFIFIASVHSFFHTFFFKSGIDKSTEWSTTPACPSLMCFFNRGDTERTNSSKILCLMFVYVLFHVNLCQD